MTLRKWVVGMLGVYGWERRFFWTEAGAHRWAAALPAGTPFEVWRRP